MTRTTDQGGTGALRADDRAAAGADLRRAARDRRGARRTRASSPSSGPTTTRASRDRRAARRPTPGPSSPGWPGRPTRIGLGTLVSPVTFRPIGNLAKVVTTVDEMSGGRVEFGLGAGWNDAEHAQLGLPFPEIGERADMLEEHFAVLHGLWGEPDGWSFEGKHGPDPGRAVPPEAGEPCRAGRRGPNGASRPRLLAGGEGSPRSMRIAARYADEFNLSSSSPATAREKFAALDAACEAIGRDPGDAGPVRDGRGPDRPRRRRAGSPQGRSAARVRQRARAARPGSATPRATLGLRARRDEARAKVESSPTAGAERLMLQDFVPRDLEMIDLMAELLF